MGYAEARADARRGVVLQAVLVQKQGEGTYTRALVDALIELSANLDLHSTLEHLVVTAARLADASYGALGVLGEDGTLVDFVTAGIDDDLREAIGPPPLGHGLLALLDLAPGPVRIDDVPGHPDFSGFPDHHPVMTSFLGVEVRAHGNAFGRLYLADKAGGAAFSEDDERMLTALANGAGIVIENTRSYQLSEARGRWLEASAAITRSLVGENLDTAFQQVADHARAVSGASASCVALLRTDELLEVRVVSGASTWKRGGPPVSVAGSIAGVALSSSDPVVVPDVHEHPAMPTLLRSIGRTGPGPAAMLPLRTRDGAAGLLVLAWDEDAAAAFRSFDVDLAGSFAEQAALALEVSRARSAGERRSLSEDRDRIARDLHDVVIQRLFAIGLQLDHASTTVSDPETVGLLTRAVDDLDLSIKDIRTSIFKLQQNESGSLRAGVHELVEEYAAVLGYAPSVVVRGPIDHAVSGSCRADALAVLREALSNVARHASASAIEVSVSVTDTHLSLVVSDDGVGLPAERSESGLLNARARAHERDGELVVGRRLPRGTRFAWTVPLA